MTQKADKYPDLDTMRAYLEQRLSATDRLAFEEMLASDPDLADDLEELELALQHPEGRERLLAHQKRVALAIQKQAPARSRTLRPGYLAMAASLLLLAAFGFWFFAKKEQPKASDFIAWNEAPAMRGGQRQGSCKGPTSWPGWQLAKGGRHVSGTGWQLPIQPACFGMAGQSAFYGWKTGTGYLHFFRGTKQPGFVAQQPTSDTALSARSLSGVEQM